MQKQTPAKDALIELMDQMIETSPHRVNFMDDYKKKLRNGDAVQAARICFMLEIPVQQDGLMRAFDQIRDQVLVELRQEKKHGVAKLCRGWPRQMSQMVRSVYQAQHEGKFEHYVGGVEAAISDAIGPNTKSKPLFELSGLTKTQTEMVIDYYAAAQRLRRAPVPAY